MKIISIKQLIIITLFLLIINNQNINKVYSHPIIIINDIDPSQIENLTKTSINGNECFSGYIEVNKTYGATLFYIFHPSQSNPLQNPFGIWLQGGPGDSAMVGMFMENGPVLISSNGTLYNNPYSWNKLLNMLYIDNPAGTGFSYVNNSAGYVVDEDDMANELYIGLTIFFQKYTKYFGNDLYIFGESYGGKYTPSIAYKIMSKGNILNLKGIGIGDGWTDPINQVTTFANYSVSTGLIDPNQKSEIEEIQNQCVNFIENQEWLQASEYFRGIIETITNMSGGVNIYDIREYGDYDYTSLSNFLNSPETQKSLGVNKTWIRHSSLVMKNLFEDMSKSVRSFVSALLYNNYKVLIYNGEFDLIVNTVGTLKWINQLNWKYIDNFKNTTAVTWEVDNKFAGLVRNYENLWQIFVSDAGHLL
ncbi:serine carboxypeptidase-like 48-related [Anaeramoeba ignava]|uniref:Carboxypeptidase n=1 Tax=Anaeramoeba ignava TaxID=1746090 RepID=A0A9Q0LKS9_ANAIG|nr:serine carboxypeptidase-like 48-related [Anaeramoeba ignava]